jgi:hypothetical protein
MNKKHPPDASRIELHGDNKESPALVAGVLPWRSSGAFI